MAHFPVPAFFDLAETKEALWRERSVTSGRLRRLIRQMSRSLESARFLLDSHRVYSRGFPDDEIAHAQEDGVVGDVCTVLLREDGSTDAGSEQRSTLLKYYGRFSSLSRGGRCIEGTTTGKALHAGVNLVLMMALRVNS